MERPFVRFRAKAGVRNLGLKLVGPKNMHGHQFWFRSCH
jgi:hypothetical protein